MKNTQYKYLDVETVKYIKRHEVILLIWNNLSACISTFLNFFLQFVRC